MQALKERAQGQPVASAGGNKEPRAPAPKVGEVEPYSIRNKEEADLVAKMKGQGRSPEEILTALHKLRMGGAEEFGRASQVKPDDPFPTNTMPTGPIGGKAFGEAETNRVDASQANKQGIRAQNEALARLADAGYRVVQQPTETKGPDGKPVLTGDMQNRLGLDSDKKPDALIEGRVFDVYSPTTNNAKNVYDEISEKAGKDQAHRIVLNLRNSDVQVRDLRRLLQENPIPKLKEIILIDKSGNISHLFPFQG